jgi:hypothetical protein
MTAKRTPKVIMPKKDEALMPISIEDVQDKIIVLRGEPVILDRDIAKLYGVQTKDINRAVKNNPEKFPSGYSFVLDNQEVAEMRLKILTTSSESAENKEVKPVFSKSHYNPTAFTERGLYMMATILRSKQAVLTTIAIIDTFASVKELARTLKELNNTEKQEEQKGLLKKTGELIGEIIGNDMATSEIETELELNFAVLKLKHTIKRKKK